MNVNRLKALLSFVPADAEIDLLNTESGNFLRININYEVELYIDLDNDKGRIGYIIDDDGEIVDCLHQYSEVYLEEEPFTWLKNEMNEEYAIELEMEYQLVIKPQQELVDEETRKRNEQKLIEALETQLFSKPLTKE